MINKKIWATASYTRALHVDTVYEILHGSNLQGEILPIGTCRANIEIQGDNGRGKSCEADVPDPF